MKTGRKVLRLHKICVLITVVSKATYGRQIKSKNLNLIIFPNKTRK